MVSILRTMWRNARLRGRAPTATPPPIVARAPSPFETDILSGPSVDDALALVRVRRALGPPFVPVVDARMSDDGRSVVVTTPRTDHGIWAFGDRGPRPSARVAVRIGQICLLAHEVIHDIAHALTPSIVVSRNLPRIFVEHDGFVACHDPFRFAGTSALCGGGTLRYVAPECIEVGHTLGNFAWGQFSAGAFTVELLSRQRFYPAGISEFDRLADIRAGRRHRPLEERGIDDALVPILARMTNHDANARYPTLVAAREALTPFAATDDDVRAWLRDATSARAARAGR